MVAARNEEKLKRLAAEIGATRQVLIESATQFRTDGPQALTNAAWAKDFNEVKTIGALHSTTRTPDETDAAIFWQDHAFGLWNRVFRTLAASRHLDIVDSARLVDVMPWLAVRVPRPAAGKTALRTLLVMTASDQL